MTGGLPDVNQGEQWTQDGEKGNQQLKWGSL